MNKQIVTLNKNKQNEVLNKILDMLPPEPRDYNIDNDPGFWTDGKEILCPSEIGAEIVAEFLIDILSEFGDIDVNTGYYNLAEAAQNGGECNHAGFWYISFDNFDRKEGVEIE